MSGPKEEEIDAFMREMYPDTYPAARDKQIAEAQAQNA
jgi:hypothetical protein